MGRSPDQVHQTVFHTLVKCLKWTTYGQTLGTLEMVCMGAGSAQLLRQLMLGQPTLVDAKAYSPERLQNKILA